MLVNVSSIIPKIITHIKGQSWLLSVSFLSVCEALTQMPLTQLHVTLKGCGTLLLHILCVGLIIFLALSSWASRLDQITSSAVLRRLLSQFSALKNKAFCLFCFFSLRRKLSNDKPCTSQFVSKSDFLILNWISLLQTEKKKNKKKKMKNAKD